jgi:RNA polymerase sigma-70 factor, ECF subfamily
MNEKSMAYSDENIIELCLRGDERGYVFLIKKYEKLVFNLVLKIVKQRADADEVAQDVFLRIFRYLQNFRQESSLSTWIYKITYSTALNHLRKKNMPTVDIDDLHVQQSLPFSDMSNVFSALEKEEKRQQIEAAIAALPPNYATIITLFYLYEQKIEEISIAMNMSVSNVKTQLSRARQRLKVIIEEQFELVQHED